MSNAQVWYVIIAGSIILLLAVIMFSTAMEQRVASAHQLGELSARTVAVEDVVMAQQQGPPGQQGDLNLGWRGSSSN